MSTAIATKTPSIDVAAIVAEVAGRMNVTAADILGTNRHPMPIDARQLVCWVLSRAGLNPAEISRAMGKEHSTIVHSLGRAKLRPEWDSLADTILAKTNTGSLGLRSRLAFILTDVQPDVAGAIRACVYGLVLGIERHSGPRAAYGLMLLARNTMIRHAVQGALHTCEFEGQACAIDRMAARLGYPLNGPAWQAPVRVPALVDNNSEVNG
ncbi:MAG: hypothetical protein JWO59_702 [Chloroflexi bacterium]|nr:hypothetical protein [Chloroflexota bacterium]